MAGDSVVLAQTGASLQRPTEVLLLTMALPVRQFARARLLAWRILQHCVCAPKFRAPRHIAEEHRLFLPRRGQPMSHHKTGQNCLTG